MTYPKYGVCMEGLEEPFTLALLNLASQRQHITYLEIGLAYAWTMRTVCPVLKETGVPFRAIGIDPRRLAEPNGFEVINARSQDALLTWTTPIDICLIDGCHCHACVTADFTLVEPHITPGGLVLFHDFGPPATQGVRDQHGDQDRNGTQPIAVHQAVSDLGLLDGSRPGWRQFGIWSADFANYGATNMAVFQKL